MFVKDLRKEFYDVLLGNRVLILVNYDIDALCATKLLTTLFQLDNILYTVVPIWDAEDLIQVFNQHRSLKYVILVNLGGTFDVVDLLEPDDDHVFFVADNHRPIDISNIYRTEQLRLLINETDNEDYPTYDEVFRSSDGEDEEDDNQEGRRFTLEELEKRKERREWAEAKRRILFEYTQFSYFGESVSWIFFNLAWKMSKDNNELLWLSIVGIFDLYYSNKVNRGKFEEYCAAIKTHLRRLGHQMNDVNLFNVESSNIDDILSVPVGRRSCITLCHQKDLHLILYRHWSLFESLRHTPFTACRFKVWNVKGHKRLLEFLAELGLPLVQCKQNFTAMDFELRKNVLGWVEDLSEKYGLDRIIGDSFMANYGYKHRFMAGDMAHAVRALLESPKKELSIKEKFMRALDALSWSNTDVLLEGVEIGKAQMIAILKQVHDMVDMKMITSAGPFLHAAISESTPDAQLFCYPGCLLLLARFLLTAFAASSKKKRIVNLPLVLVVGDVNSPGMALAAGIPPMAEESPRNLFGKAFIQAGQMMNCQMEPTFYDLSVIKFPTEERSNLLEALISLLG